jgi:hypothetical protein
MRNILIILVIAVTAASCENTAEESRRFSAYYDIDSLINSQLILLSGMTVRVNKGAKLNSRTDTSSYKADSLQLAQELSAFRKANINKPANEGLYTKKVSSQDSLHRVEYFPVDEKEDLEVRYVNLLFKDGRLMKMEAHVVEDHWLYDSNRILTLAMSDKNEPAFINYYKIKGSQKMIFRDRVNFVVEGSIIPEAVSLR